MNNEIPLHDISLEKTFEKYESKYKAVADKKRLHIMNLLRQHGAMCVCDMVPLIGMPQSKLSYHLKILFDAEIIVKETRGTWSYYSLNQKEVDNLLSEELCCLFR
ncbi:ArsR/SmtB family transcription factor [Sutcliffiella sp. NPDC057660]|uniref:ArsR/SmtB family transcription factor n=1 Tax=Sutcliffiella sp. NPDC057660 TaxID=3346199 RepID=UPI003677E039